MKEPEQIPAKMEATFKRAGLSEFFQIIPTSENTFFWLLWSFKVGKKRNIVPVGLARHSLKKLVHSLGFRKLKDIDEVIYIRQRKIRLSSLEEIKKVIFDLFDLLKEKESITFNKILEHFQKELLVDIYLRQQHTALNKSSLLDYLNELEYPILIDTRGKSYIPFLNGVLCITSDQNELISYNNIDGVIWEEQIRQHNFEMLDYSNFMFVNFVHNVCANDQERVKCLRTIMGYLAHNYFDQAETRAVILQDEEAATSDEPEGGSGKGITAQALNQIRNVVTLDGKRFKSDNKFLFQQVLPIHQVIHIDDAKSNFDTVTLNSALSDGLITERKGRDPIKIPKERTPKILISTNTGIKTEGTTRKRRQIIFPFGNYYSKLIRSGDHNPIISVHGKRFFGNDWNGKEWGMFFSYMADCIQLYLTFGLVEIKSDEIRKISLKTSTSLEFAEYILAKIDLNTKYETSKVYKEYLAKYELDESEFKQRTFSNWLKKYASIYSYSYANETTNGIGYFTIKN